MSNSKDDGTGFRSTVMPHADELEIDDSALNKTSTKNSIRPPKKLALNDDVKPARTRTALYKELAEGEKVLSDEDHYDLPTPLRRGVGFLIDVVFLYGLFELIIFLLPLEYKTIRFFMDMNKWVFILKELTMIKLLMAANYLFALFFFIIVPTAFFNTSVGKKVTGLRVRGEGQYTLSLAQAFTREIIWKPIGVLFLVGFIVPFFNKKKKSLHDKIARTFVVCD